MTTVWVAGRPVPQGSMIPLRTATGGVRLRQPTELVDYRDRLATELARHHLGPPLTTPVTVTIGVVLARPAYHFGTGRNLSVLKAGAPPWPTSRRTGDADKLARTVLDALVIAGVLADDSQVVMLRVTKSWADELRPGLSCSVTEVD